MENLKPTIETVVWQDLSPKQQHHVLQRPAVKAGGDITTIVTDIITHVQKRGDSAIKDMTEKFDGITQDTIAVSPQQVQDAIHRLDTPIKTAIKNAYDNIKTFHSAQQSAPIRVETQTGVVCEQITRPISTVGLYIPGGSAPLPSTVLMLGIPAQLAGCKKVVLCSPPPIADEILYVAQLCGIRHIYAVGGAQAIAGMAYGTETIPKVDKIFGPGNAFVTEAKCQVSNDLQGASIDMPAGPSEVLVIADENADPEFVSADLLSQAEHGADSQVILVTPSPSLAQSVTKAIYEQLNHLSRGNLTAQALEKSRIIIASTLDECVNISNAYAPEHLIIQTDNARDLLPDITHAGSVFLGHWSPESVGDYASGTNHVLPTYGYARTYSSLGLADFSKRMTVQELTPDGLKSIASTVVAMANAEGLDAHRNAVTIRTDKLQYKIDKS